MKKNTIILLLLICGSYLSKAQFIPVADPAFAKYLCDSLPQVMSADCKQLDTTKASLITSKINAVGLGINNANELKYFKQVVWISLKSNNLTAIPDLSSLPLLTDLNCSENKLTGVLNLSKYSTLEIVTLNGNAGVTGITGITQLSNLRKLQLTQCNLESFPDLSSITTLQVVAIDYNRLSFTDLLPISQQPSYSTIYKAFPQKRIPDDTKQELNQSIHSNLQIDFTYDTTISGLSYTWYKNSTIVKSSSDNFLNLTDITEADSGTYFVKVKSNSPMLKGDSLVGRKWHLTIRGCNSVSSYELENLSDCKNLQYRLNNIEFDFSEATNKFYIENKITHQQTEIKKNELFSITPGNYTLKVQMQNQCELKIDSVFKTNFLSECTKYFTPNGDGIMDDWYIDYSGIVKIFDANGVLIKELISPNYWDGKATDGHWVPDGKYMLLYDDKTFSELSLYR